jgi:hypothetical protein
MNSFAQYFLEPFSLHTYFELGLSLIKGAIYREAFLGERLIATHEFLFLYDYILGLLYQLFGLVFIIR